MNERKKVILILAAVWMSVFCLGCRMQTIKIYDSYTPGEERIAGAVTNPYDTATPAGTDDPREADDRMRETKAAVQEFMNDHDGETDEGDHYWPLDGTEVNADDTGQHRKITFRTMADDPDSLTSYATLTDLGFLYTKDSAEPKAELFWQDEDGDVIQITSKGKVNLNGAYVSSTALSQSTSDASDNSSVTMAGGGASGVTRGAYITLFGNEHATDPGELKLCAGYSAGTTKAIIDAVNSLISNVVDPVSDQDAATKVYCDMVAGISALDSESNAMVKNHAYLAQVDGFVSAYATLDAEEILTGYMDDTNDPYGAGTKVQHQTGGLTSGDTCSIYFAVPAGWYFEIRCSDTPTIFWQSIGADSKPVDQD